MRPGKAGNYVPPETPESKPMKKVSICAGRLQWRATQGCIQETHLPELAKNSTLPAIRNPCAPLRRMSQETTLRGCAFE